MSTKMTPQLRFPEFTDVWQVKKLGDTVKFEQGVQVDLPQQKPTPFEDSVKFLRIENYTQRSQDFRYISKKIAGKKYINDDEVAVVRYGATAGFIATGQSGVLANNLFSVRSNGDSISNKFLSLRLKQPRTYSYFQSEMSGGAMPALSFSIVSRYKFAFPSKPEQEKIADFLTAVDERIAVGEKKLELLETYKRGVMQKIFSQQVRFKDDNGKPYPDWEEKKLGDIAKKENSPISANEIVGRSGKYKVYGASGLLQTLDSYNQGESYTAIVKDGAGVGRLMWCEAESSVLGTLNIIKPKLNGSSKFLHYLLHTINFQRYSIGSTIPHVYFSDYSKHKLVVPESIEEQQKNATFLATLDDKITAEKSKLTATRKFKKALLQKMFV